jgi:PAS domain S-box-containing protein
MSAAIPDKDFTSQSQPNNLIDASSLFEQTNPKDEAQSDIRWPMEIGSALTKEDLLETNQLLTEVSSRFEEMFQGLPMMCYCYDSEGRIREWNRSCETETGLTASDVLQKPIWEVFPNIDDETKIREMVRGVFNGQSFEGLELEMVRVDGSRVPVISNTFPLRNGSGEIVGAISANIDISQRVIAETAMRESEEHLRLALDLGKLGNWDWDLDTDIIRFSRIDAEIMGIPPISLEAPREMLSEVIHPDDREFVDQCSHEARISRKPFEVEYRVVRPDGTIRWVVSRAAYLFEFDRPTRLYTTTLDITERKQNEEELRLISEELEQRVERRTNELRKTNEKLQEQIAEKNRVQDELKLYADIIQNIQIGIHVFQQEDMDDPTSLRLISCNPAMSKHTGLPFDEFIGKMLSDMLAGQKDPGIAKLCAESVQTGLPQYQDIEIAPLGDAVIFAMQAFPLQNNCVGIGMETVTEQRAAQRELERMHQENSHIIASINSVLVCVNEDFVITAWNQLASEAFGVNADQAIGRKLEEIDIDWNWDPILHAIGECARTEQPIRIDDHEYISPIGQDRFINITINPLQGVTDYEEQQLTGFLMLGIDNTNRRILESQLAQAQKLESIGNLAAGIAHEINTPIQYVGDNSRFLQDAFNDLSKLIKVCKEIVEEPEKTGDAQAIVERLKDIIDEADAEYLIEEIPTAIKQSLEGVDRVAHIVRAMKEFSHPGNEELTAIDLNRAIDSTVTVARNEWKYVADVESIFEEDMPPVPCYPGAFNQVILNILINAAHAVGDVVAGTGVKGTIKISTKQVNRFAEIRISDSGTGIPQEILGRIFNPFFTTKPVGRGTGQGLAISHTVIVEKHHGTIDVETKIGAGTTFIIRLPLDKAK